MFSVCSHGVSGLLYFIFFNIEHNAHNLIYFEVIKKPHLMLKFHGSGAVSSDIILLSSPTFHNGLLAASQQS